MAAARGRPSPVIALRSPSAPRAAPPARRRTALARPSRGRRPSASIRRPACRRRGRVRRHRLAHHPGGAAGRPGDPATRRGPRTSGRPSWRARPWSSAASSCGTARGWSPSPAATWRGFAGIAVLLALGQVIRAVTGVGMNPSSAGLSDLPLAATGPVAVLVCVRLVRSTGGRIRHQVALDAARRAHRAGRSAPGAGAHRHRACGQRCRRAADHGLPDRRRGAGRGRPGHLRGRVRGPAGRGRLAAAVLRVPRRDDVQRCARRGHALTAARRRDQHRLPGDAGRGDAGPGGRPRPARPLGGIPRRGAAGRRRRQLLPVLRRAAPAAGGLGRRPSRW